MKSSVCYKYIMAAVSALMLAGLGSCVQDDYGLRGDSGDYDGIALRIKLPEQKQVNPMTRALASDFDKVNDLNIFVGDENGKIQKRLYLDVSALTLDQENTIDTDVTVTPKKDGNGYVEYTIDFTPSYWSGVSIDKSKFYAVANWGSEMKEVVDVINDEGNPATAALNTIDQLKGLKVRELKSNGNVHSTVPTPNAMYGEETPDRGETPDPDDSSKKIKVVTIEMKRTAVMITLALDGSGLSENIEISVDSVVLRNVPKSCTLGPVDISGSAGPGNCPTSHEDISKYGDMKGGVVFSSAKLIGQERKNLAAYQNDSQFQTTIGGHYTDVESGNFSDVTGTFVQPLFLFENRQPTGTSEGSPQNNLQAHKRPNGLNVSGDDYDGAIAKYNESGVCSYIEVYAKYTQYDGTTANVSQKGTASWRFFLGNNVTDNFDVERNTNYRITLDLNGTGIGERNYSWRVDADLKQAQVVGNENMVVGGGGEMFCVEFTRNDVSEGNFKITHTFTDDPDKNANFVWAYMRPSSGADWQWMQLSELSQTKAFKYWLSEKKQLWFYVSPLLPGGNESPISRSAKIEFYYTNEKDPLATVTFTQYRPVSFSVTANDLTNHPDDPDLQRAVFLLEEYYGVDCKATGFTGFEFWADRIDRDPMPWGFSGIKISNNQNTGFNNVYHLIDKPADGSECLGHYNEAAHYLPTGKGYRETNSDYIDFSNGSCMIHAAAQNHFQHYGNAADDPYRHPDNSVTPDELLDVTLETIYRPGAAGSPDDDNTYSWCVPSVAGCQLVEVLDRYYKRIGDTDRGFDPNYPIKPWVSYWTSNAATADMNNVEAYKQLNINGMNRSFVYQFDMGLDDKDYKFGDKGTQVGNDTYPAYYIVPRSTPIMYRLLNIRPNSISGSGSTN